MNLGQTRSRLLGHSNSPHENFLVYVCGRLQQGQIPAFSLDPGNSDNQSLFVLGLILLSNVPAATEISLSAWSDSIVALIFISAVGFAGQRLAK